MLETNDFFEDQITQCRAQAERAANKADREFWLRLAERWKELLRAKQPNSNDSRGQPPRKHRFGRTRFTRRAA